MKNLFGLIVVILVAAIFAHFWTTPPERLLGSLSQPDPQAPEADSFMSGSETRRYDENGELTYRLTAVRTDFFMADSRYEIEQPEVEMITVDDIRHRARSNSGNVFHGGEEIVLEGDVIIWQHHPRERGYRLDTTRLWLYPQNQYAETDQPLTLRSERGITDGIGLHAYLTDKRFEILNNVKTLYQPQ